MPVLWFCLPPPIPPVTGVQVDSDLLVHAATVEYSADRKKAFFDSGVSAQYQATKVTADHLEVDSVAQHAIARGHVRITDPDGTAEVESIEFWWAKGASRAEASQVVVDFAGVKIKAKHAVVTPGKWILEDAFATSCRRRLPLIAITARITTLYPGRYAKVSSPAIQIMGHEVIELPTQRFNLDPRVTGIKLPTLNYSKDDGLGLAWAGSALLSESAALGANARFFPNVRPSFAVQVAKSPLSGDQSRALIIPSSDLNERFSFSYFENIEVSKPRNETDYLHEKRTSYSVGSFWFQKSPNDRSNAEYSKPLDLAIESNSIRGTLGITSQARLQAIQRETEDPNLRLAMTASAGPQPTKITRGLDAHFRVDGASFNGSTSSGWLRGMAGLVFHPMAPLTASIAWHDSTTWGSSLYPIDDLVSLQGATARFDLNGGPTQASLMWRYDSKRGWYDRQWTVSQVVGCFQPFLIYRSFYGDYRFGVNIRVGNIGDVLSRRNYERGMATRQVIDEPGRR